MLQVVTRSKNTVKARRQKDQLNRLRKETSRQHNMSGKKTAEWLAGGFRSNGKGNSLRESELYETPISLPPNNTSTTCAIRPSLRLC